MQRVLPAFYKFKVVSGTPLGRGCIAIEKIVKNEIICKMTGPSMTLKALLDKYEESEWTNPLQILEDVYLDLIEPYVCFNHSCEPNAGLRNNGILFALRDIEPNEEIYYDYSTSVDDVLWNMLCLCKTKLCRKNIGDFQSIPHERKLYYLENNALTNYIKNTFY